MALATRLNPRAQVARQLLEHPRSPLRVAGTALPATWLASAKAVTFLLFALGYHERLGEPFLPLLPVLDDVHGGAWALAVNATAWGGVALLFSNVAVRVGSVMVGVAMLAGMIAEQATYLNSVTWSACFLVVVGLYTDERSDTVLRFQFSALYLGSCLSKLFDSDWHDGTFIANWRFDDSSLYDRVLDVLGWNGFHTAVGITVIAVEGLLAVLFLRPAWTNRAVALSLTFHAMPFVLNGLTFGVFLPALAVSTVALYRLDDPRDFDLRRPWRDPLFYLLLAMGWGSAHVAKDLVLG